MAINERVPSVINHRSRHFVSHFGDVVALCLVVSSSSSVIGSDHDREHDDRATIQIRSDDDDDDD